MFTVESVQNLQWCDEGHTFFECQVKYAEFAEVHPAGVNATCPDAHIKEIWAKALAGNYGPISEYVAPPQPKEVVAAPEEDQPVASGVQTL